MGETHRLPRAALTCLAAGLLLAASPGAQADRDRSRNRHSDSSQEQVVAAAETSVSVAIKQAEYSGGELHVEGTATRRTTVRLKNADTLELLGSTQANRSGEWKLELTLSGRSPCTVRAEAGGEHPAVDTADVDHAPSNCDDGSGGGTGGGGTGGGTTSGDLRVLGANDLGMHCVDLDPGVFSILPPFNGVHSQVVEVGSNGNAPRILGAGDVDVLYSATSSPTDPAGSGSINTTSQNLGVFKSTFWDDSGEPIPPGFAGTGSDYTVGGLAYLPLYPGVQVVDDLGGPDLTGTCGDPLAETDCPSALTLFEPNPVDRGIPVPDPSALFPANPADLPTLVTGQQEMPGPANVPQHFDRFDTDLPFFVGFPFGTRLQNLNWFAADGVPIMPVDDSGVRNAYPLMKIAAHDPVTGDQLAATDIVLPVASEADCQNCHVDPMDCMDPDLPQELQSDQCTGAGVLQTAFDVIGIDAAPGATPEQQLLNAAKINILRLHDAKHGASYANWDATKSLAAAPCDATHPENCLDNQHPIQCSRCHYSPAVDLAHAGPVDEPEQGLKGRQQTSHITMSRAMHGHHGALPDFQGAPLFPPMPGPVGRDPADADQVLGQTCYQCHPGKRTRCLRGAMFAGGVVCQDCHGDMQQVGNDFSMRVSSANPGDFVLDGTLRVPWASEPGCQSCHTGDALNNNHPSGALVANDGIRLLQAYFTEEIQVPGVADPVRVASTIRESRSPFAENRGSNSNGDTVDILYRFSTGHGGLMCEGCHNSTHAIWPNQNEFANDNIAARQLQGHSGTLIECTTCHQEDLGRTLGGPHGMHPVGDSRWNTGHENVAEGNRNSCRACHGTNGEGTVLSRMAETRTLRCDEGPSCNNGSITLMAGTPVGCGTCHENEL